MQLILKKTFPVFRLFLFATFVVSTCWGSLLDPVLHQSELPWLIAYKLYSDLSRHEKVSTESYNVRYVSLILHTLMEAVTLGLHFMGYLDNRLDLLSFVISKYTTYVGGVVHSSITIIYKIILFIVFIFICGVISFLKLPLYCCKTYIYTVFELQHESERPIGHN